MKRIVLIILVLVMTIGAFIAFKMYFKKHDDLSKKEASFQLKAAELFEAFASDENGANVKYTEQIVEITGKISKIETSDSGINLIYLKSNDLMFGIICEMNSSKELNENKVGDEVTLRGICSGYLMDVTLNRCVQIK